MKRRLRLCQAASELEFCSRKTRYTRSLSALHGSEAACEQQDYSPTGRTHRQGTLPLASSIGACKLNKQVKQAPREKSTRHTLQARTRQTRTGRSGPAPKHAHARSTPFDAPAAPPKHDARTEGHSMCYSRLYLRRFCNSTLTHSTGRLSWCVV